MAHVTSNAFYLIVMMALLTPVGPARSQEHVADQVQPDRPRALLLCIGVSDYGNSAWDLDFADDDADLYVDVLQPALACSGFEVDCKVLASDRERQDATKQNIRSEIARLASLAWPDDLVFVSFSGHGYFDGAEEFYLLPSDVGSRLKDHEPPSSEVLRDSISGSELATWLQRIDAAHMILVIDACYSARSVQQPWFKPAPLGGRGLGQLAYDKQMLVLTASQADDFAYEYQQLRHGQLTYALVIEGIIEQMADHRPRDGAISVSEWLEYGRERVPELHMALRQGTFVPREAREPGQPRVVVLTKQDDGTTRAKPATAELMAASSLIDPATLQSPVLYNFTRDEDTVILVPR